ncbi:prolyl oligopeptidase family serine peptidase [Granulicella mallensis]|uniref:Prolyl oligopeptidase n=1 Tax=Granulicella mallensis (strain ATCC BAA-1857 / DSM 23137 / MP5ACTX8) TaxID=682795 RepID=G8NXH0_GRAMM|nr:prolyl oligopeptidase family serine peptidase [Granulicella mallensis]AEU38965.1 Prolyl oligopeptidase [Granulicella mallensis MP5ACTX8]
MRERVRRSAVVLTAMLVLGSGARMLAQQGPSDSTDTDKYVWLEDVSSDRSMNWVKDENERTAKVLENDPHFAAYHEEALKLSQAPDRLPYPDLRGGDVYNFWRDAEHVNGIFRKTSLSDYLTLQPKWQTVIDYDALGKQDSVKWVSHGLDCLYPGDHYCLVGLSAGGEDADTMREFDLKTGKFVEGGFTLPHSKQSASWLDKDTLLIARDWGPGTMTKSGYPFVVKEWKRGTPLDTAKEVFRGQESDISAGAYTLHDTKGHSLTVFTRGVSFFESQSFVQTPQGLKQLSIPLKANLSGMIDGRVLLSINEDWTPAGQSKSFRQGSLLEMNLAEVVKDPAHLKPTVVFEPTAQEFLQGVDTTKTRLLLTTLNHVQGKAYIYTPTANGWTKKSLPVPENSTVGVITTNESDDTFFLSITGFLTPSSLWLGDAATTSLKLQKTEPARFDASKDVVEQLEATSKDGTKVPYFVVHRKDLKYDGSNATLLNAYGGFEVAETPSYSANIGKLWLENGGVFVLANIRGGGEFGPAWHEAGLKTHRQRIYDDFAAVGEDLIARKITSPKHLGIMGGSNGGLLMGVEMTQHPDLWNAVVIQVPLLDMLRFEQIAAGASWVGEYGSVSIPEQRTFLASISPYNQLKPDVKYPEPLIFTTTKDDRVGPQHARKFAAKMEEYHEPFFYDEIIEGGHAAGADLKEQAKTWALTYTYLTRKLMGE